MTSTATMTTTAPMPTLSLSLSTDRDPPLSAAAAHCCPSCGLDLPPPTTTASIHTGKIEGEDAARSLLEAQARIADLEAQVRLLNQKASAAIDRWADYEDELALLRKQTVGRAQSAPPEPQDQGTPTRPQTAAPPTPSPTRSSFLPSGAGGVANRLSALLSRKSQPNLPPQSAAPASASAPNLALPTDGSPDDPPPSPGASEPQHPLNAHADLLSALRHEQKLRVAAESRLSTTSKEVEELSVSLFEQANEMVATERRARAKLEERVEVLEKRDVDKKRRLERLEGAMGRIERVRALLGEERSRRDSQTSSTLDAGDAEDGRPNAGEA